MTAKNDCTAYIQRVYRRDFLKLVAAAGLFVVTGCNAGQEPTATAPNAPTATPTITPTPGPTAIPTYSAGDFDQMAYCGIRCLTACPGRKYPKSCVGCKATEGKRDGFCESCAIRKCADEKQVFTCAHCDEYPTCENELWTKYPTLRRKIDQLRKDLNIQS